jgi:hypothetical protein
MTCEHCGCVVTRDESYTFWSPPIIFDCLCRACAIHWQHREQVNRVQHNGLLRVAQEVTDEVLGPGTYARVNAPPLTIQEEPDGHDL